MQAPTSLMDMLFAWMYLVSVINPPSQNSIVSTRSDVNCQWIEGIYTTTSQTHTVSKPKLPQNEKQFVNCDHYPYQKTKI